MNVFEYVFSPLLLLTAYVVAGLVFLILAQRRNDFETTLSGTLLLATVFGTLALTGLFGVLFHRPRPPFSLQLVHETGYGFPSQHAVTVVAVGAAFWYLFGLRPLKRWVGSWRGRFRIGLSVVPLALLVGFGCIYTGALSQRRAGGVGARRRVGLRLPDGGRGLQALARQGDQDEELEIRAKG